MADSGTYTPETLQRRYKIAEQLLADPKQPIRHWAEGLNELAKGALGGYQMKRTETLEADQRKQAVAQALSAFGGGETPPAQAAPASPAAPPATPPVPDNTPMAGLPRGLRNNNPLNIEAGSFTQAQPGFSGSDGRFAKFAKPEDGIGAANSLLDSYGRKGLNTPAGIVGRWAPSSDGNNVSAYAQDVAQKLGIGPNDPISPEMRPQLISAMGQHENGRPIGDVAAALQRPAQVAQNQPQAPQQPAAPAGANSKSAIAALLNPWTPPALAGALAGQISPSYGFQTLPDGTILRTNPKSGTVEPVYNAPTKNTFGVIGENRDGQKIYGIINPEKGTATPVQVPGTASAPNAPDSGLSGDDFLKSLNDTGRADLIKQMVEGRIAPAQMGRFGTQAVQSLLKDAARYEPGFDATKWTARNSTSKDFASGQAAKNVTSINTVIGHLGDLSEKADALGNSSFTPYNEYIKNPLANVTGSPEVKNFNLARNAVADEMAKVFRGGGLSDAETRQWKENISAAGSPEQLKGAVKTAIGLMESRLNALNEQRNKGMSTTLEPSTLLDEKSRKTLDRVRSWADGAKPEAKPATTEGPDPAALAEAKRRGLIK